MNKWKVKIKYLVSEKAYVKIYGTMFLPDIDYLSDYIEENELELMRNMIKINNYPEPYKLFKSINNGKAFMVLEEKVN